MGVLINECNRSNCKFCVSSVIITNLKEINDSYGFDIGDKVILLFVERIREQLNKMDFLGRIGDNHFLLITNYNSFESQTSKLKSLFNKCVQKPFILRSGEIYITLDIGVSIYPENGRIVKDLIEAASLAIHNVKNEDWVNISFYSKELSNMIKEKTMMLNLLKKALTKQEFSLSFQPKVNSIDNRLVGAETLIRWNNDVFGNVSPIVFIPLAEENGLINEISKWIICELCSLVDRWKNIGLQYKPVSFNLSPIDFKRDDFISQFLSLISPFDVTGDDVEIEITEGALINNIEAVKNKIDTLKEKGFKFLIDDFGTGYSSLSYLKKLDIDVLKIDRSFIKDYPEKSDGIIARTITGLAKSLQIDVICEGVENEEQIKFLRSIGCNTIQGYYYSKPVSAKEFEKILQRGYLTPHS